MSTVANIFPLIRALVFGIIGFLAGMALAALLRNIMDLDPWVAEPVILVGYVFGLIGWLLGIGVWGAWTKEWLGLDHGVSHEQDWGRYLRFSTDHKVIGVQYLVTMVVLLLVAASWR